MTGRTLAHLLAALLALTSAASIHAQTRDAARADGKDFATDLLGEAREVFFSAPHAAIVPGVLIFLLVMGINLLGDGLRDVLDPKEGNA